MTTALATWWGIESGGVITVRSGTCIRNKTPEGITAFGGFFVGSRGPAGPHGHGRLAAEDVAHEPPKPGVTDPVPAAGDEPCPRRSLWRRRCAGTVLDSPRSLQQLRERPRVTAGTLSTTYFFTYSRSYYLIHPPVFRHMALGPRPTHSSFPCWRRSCRSFRIRSTLTPGHCC